MFAFDQTDLDPPTATSDFDIHLTARLRIFDGDRVVFEEVFVAIIGLAAQWRRWLDEGVEAGEEFVYEDDSLTLGELFRFTAVGDGHWRVSSVYDSALALEMPGPDLVAGVEAALTSIRDEASALLGADRARPWLP
ncbi:DUF7878 domain-containing protein [Actinomycetospora soli]|uniref:DUF7878 domain-containing protein n=1 Tax=Actinomycetospora soli TaxID=2893887 RepID=UPI001E5A39B7|nr:hypothetical protein [Actinomycetospora soli]MCD2191233.1 hypothetical protein [Actinomycetospora soli]